jgi:tRNA U34 5-carboxymethylaminomethyl modifying GTPase MnmE/TrmE
VWNLDTPRRAAYIAPNACDLAARAASRKPSAGLAHLGHITGTVDVEDLLDVIFRDFCTGK